MEKLSSNDYTFTVTAESAGCKVVLTQTSSGKTKEFFQAGTTEQHRLVGLTNHMNSLTDSLCEQWFNVKVPKKKEKKVTT